MRALSESGFRLPDAESHKSKLRGAFKSHEFIAKHENCGQYVFGEQLHESGFVMNEYDNNEFSHPKCEKDKWDSDVTMEL
jgi:hypothetical protein